MNKVAARRFLAAAFSAWGTALWITGGIRALREEKQAQIWQKAEEETSEPETAEADGVSSG